MLYEICREIQAELQAKKCPIPVHYGPERLSTKAPNSRIVIERDRAGTDTFTAPKTRTPNPKMFYVRAVACVCRVFAKSTIQAAAVFNHEREVDQIVDMVAVSLQKVVRKRMSECRITRGALLDTAELEMLGLETWPGVVYQINFEVDRGVYDVDWAKEAAQEATIGEGGVILGGADLEVGGTASGNNQLPNVTTEIE